MSCVNLAKNLDGARIVYYDEDLNMIFAWFGGKFVGVMDGHSGLCLPDEDINLVEYGMNSDDVQDVIDARVEILHERKGW